MNDNRIALNARLTELIDEITARCFSIVGTCDETLDDANAIIGCANSMFMCAITGKANA